MASFFQSFRSSSMPKRLLRYALARLELLDAETLDMDNLDLALGKNSVFEFRDVGVRLKKLEKLLNLPDSMRLQKSKVHLLRVTIPMDFYTSPILVEVDGVSVTVSVSGQEDKAIPTNASNDEASIVPDPVNLAQSFLETQPSSERLRLEEALAAETQDLGASVSVSDDGSEDEVALGTGQGLSLPTFLADFLQGIVDRTQIKINGVTFQMDVEVPVDATSSSPESVSFQIALQDIDVEGVTTGTRESETDPALGLKEGKRRILLNNVRAYLISEANVFSTFVQSPSLASPSLCSSPRLTRSSSTHDHEELSSRQSDPESPISHSTELEPIRDQTELEARAQSPLEDSEEALGIPYEMSQPDEPLEDEGPATPRASVYHGADDAMEQSIFHSTYLPDNVLANTTAFEADVPQWASTHTDARSEPAYVDAISTEPWVPPETEHSHASPGAAGSDRSSESSGEDLARSHLFTHDEAESMYMSAFSTSGPSPPHDAPPAEVQPSLEHSTQSLEEPSSPVAEVYMNAQAQSVTELQTQSVAALPSQSITDLPAQSAAGLPAQSVTDLQTQSVADLPSQSIMDLPAQSVTELPAQNAIDLPTQSVAELPSADSNDLTSDAPVVEESKPPKDLPAARNVMPGGWDDSSDDMESSNIADSVSYSAPQDSERTKSAPVSSPEASAASSAVLGQVDAGHKDGEEATGAPIESEDAAATPRGSTRLVKEILSLDRITLYIPHSHQHIQVHLDPENESHVQAMSKSGYPQAPGAFSLYGGSSIISHAADDVPNPPHDGEKSLEVHLSPVSIRFDTSIGFLLAMVVSRLAEAVKPNPETSKPESQQEKEPGSNKTPNVKASIEEISIDFVHHLPGVADTAERFMDPTAFILDHDVLLNVTLQQLSLSRESIHRPPGKPNPGPKSSSTTTVTKIELEKFRFGYADDDIISFDKARPVSMSVRDTFLSTGYDLGMKITQIGEKVRTDIETLPLVVHIDLQRLDETFSWFGGLSSLLHMSASLTSNTPAPVHPAPQKPAKPRGVRFETPLDPEKQLSTENKTNLRIGSAFIKLQGRECSVIAESSAIKLVNREEGIGVAISVLRVKGPYLTHSAADPAITVDVSGVRLDYLMTPTDADMERLLGLITPSKLKFDQDNDEIMVDTLLRQRRKGSVLRATLDTVNVRVKNLSALQVLPNLGEEIAKLSTVAKYLPEDDRPGLLTLGRIQKLNVSLAYGGQLGLFEATLDQLDVGHITIPSLVALAIYGLEVKRNHAEDLVGTLDTTMREDSERSPVIMLRIIADEIEPVVKLKLQNLIIEYRVPFIMDILGLEDDATPQDFEAGLAASVANLGEQAQISLAKPKGEEISAKSQKPMGLDIGFRDCVIGLNPLNLPSKMLISLTDARLEVALPQGVKMKAELGIKKTSVLLIDDIALSSDGGSRAYAHRRSSSISSRQINEFCARGFVNVCYISSAKVIVDVIEGPDKERQVDVEVRDDLLVLETCADSTQTLITLVNALKPPTPPSKEEKYRFEVMPVQDLLSSISAEAFGNPEGEYDFDQDFAGAQEMAGSHSDTGFESDQSLKIDAQYYGADSQGEEMFDAMKSSGMSQGTTMQDTAEGVLLTGFNSVTSALSDSGDELIIHENYYDREASKNSTAKIWNSSRCSYDDAPAKIVKRSPFRLSAKNVHFIWNLFDGYDWARTRDVISQAVRSVEDRAIEAQLKRDGVNIHEEELEDEEAIGDFLFNSIYIGIPANRQPGDLTQAINQELNDNATETESIATTALTDASNRTVRPHQAKAKRLRLYRSKHHKMTFELQGINADMVLYPSDAGETQSSVDVRVNNLDIFDHVPTSTWKKFATYDRDSGEREMGTSMMHLELLNVKPMPELVASESVLRVTVLPLRLHVDQDALDFLTRFFEFKDEDVPVHASPSDIPFVQRAEINAIPVKLDFKPKRVDYAGLRSGRTTEFMNFIVMEESRLVLRHIIIYGISGFDRLGKTLNDIWMPDVRGNQLPGVLAGLAPVRSLVNIGSGFKDLVEIPIREYKKDGRVIRSISKGAAAFARTTGTEIVKLGAKLAVGTQYALQGAEEMLTEQNQSAISNWDDDDMDPEDKKQISLYADQPPSVLQGLRGGYRSLARDMNVARDAIIAVPGEVMQSPSPGSAARAVWKRTPTIIFRPAMGVSKAIGQTLLGATNAIDPQHRRRIDEKYKKH